MSDNPLHRRWARSIRLLELTQAEPELMGPTLLALHATIETRLRVELAARRDLTADERDMIELRQVSGPPLLRLAQRYLGTGRTELEELAQANRDRRTLLRGEPYPGDFNRLWHYAQVVARRCGFGALPAMEPDLEDDEPVAQRPPRARRAPTGRTNVPYLSDSLPAGIGVRQLVMLAATLVLAMLFFYALYSTFLGAPRDTVSTLPEPAAAVAAAPPPTLIPSPQRTASIVRLNGAIGFLRDAPTFASGTKPPRIEDGMTVTVLDDPPVEADGTTWQLVSINGYDGWCPLNNLEMAR